MLFGASANSAFLAEQFFLGILIFSMNYIGKKMYSPALGLLCAVAASLFPFSIFMSHEYLLDYPSAAMAALAFAFLLASDGFSKKVPSILFFVALSAGTLIKWTTPVFLIVPASMVFARFYGEISKSKDRKSQFTILVFLLLVVIGVLWGYRIFHDAPLLAIRSNSEYFILLFKSALPLLILFAAALLLPGINSAICNFYTGLCLFFILIWHYYIPALPELTKSLVAGAAGGVGEGDPTGIIAYLSLFVTGFQGIFQSVFLLIGLLMFCLKQSRKFEEWICFAGSAFCLILLYVLPNRDVRYFMPVLIFTAPLMVVWLMEIRKKYLRYALLAIFVIISVIGSAGWLFTGSISQASLAPLEFSMMQPRPSEDNWHYSEIMDNVIELSKDKKTVIMFSEVRYQNSPPITINSIAWYYLLKTGIPMSVLPGDCEAVINGVVNKTYLISNNLLKKGDKVDSTIELLIYPRQYRPDIPLPLDRAYTNAGVEGDRQFIDEYELPNNLNARLSVYKPGIQYIKK
jgi:hypothetical protein